MKSLSAFTVFFLLMKLGFCQGNNKIENIIIITTDGFRWQEVFKGADKEITDNPVFNQGKAETIDKKYSASTYTESRKKLMPFLWSTISAEGQIYGNRTLNNKVDNANPYWFSYPGYSEIFCGFVDTAINSNKYKANPNTNILEFFNKQKGYKNQVAAFGAWNVFDNILNEKRCGFPVICGTDSLMTNESQQLISALKSDSYMPFGLEEPLDVFTHYAALEYLKKQQPKVLYISYGETDEWAHEGHYLDYLDAAHRVDKYISDIWTYIQSTPKYKDKTALFITTDHGRGDLIKTEWTSHNAKISDSHEIWFAAIGPGIKPLGEVKTLTQIYQKQFAQTFAKLLGLDFTCEHPVASKIDEVFVK